MEIVSGGQESVIQMNRAGGIEAMEGRIAGRRGGCMVLEQRGLNALPDVGSRDLPVEEECRRRW